ncbi:MAG: UDP-N-acetylmuramoyl-L-alanyl-D-glutamate--2,6-diaminopimelate ligase [Patescibacteria group bacterium]
MFKELGLLARTLDLGRKIIPRSVFEFFQPWYHGLLALSGAVIYGWPSKKLKVIGVTGSKGKSTTVYLISRFLEEAGYGVASIGSLGFRIVGEAGSEATVGRGRSPLRVLLEWPNNLKMTMLGRWKIQKFLAEAVRAGCQFAILEVTSEGIKQKRHWGIKFDTAVFTNLEKEHIEAHKSFENYFKAKQQLFKITKNTHILNADSPYIDLFSKFPAQKKIFYSLRNYNFRSNLQGEFNKLNILAAAETVKNYGVSPGIIQKALDKIKNIPGRFEFIDRGQDFKIVIDYAHTPGSLEAVYKTLKGLMSKDQGLKQRLICVLGAAGGGRDKWKRPIFGQLAEDYCDRIILTNEDPYDESPEKIVDEVNSGIKNKKKVEKIMDRKMAIKKALTLAGKSDIVVITGKGSEISMAVAQGKKIPWSEKDVVLEVLEEIKK